MSEQEWLRNIADEVLVGVLVAVVLAGLAWLYRQRRILRPGRTKSSVEPPWSTLAKQMRAIMEYPYRDLILGKEGETWATASLRSFFAACLAQPDHDFIRRGAEMQDSDRAELERRKGAYVGWQRALEQWQGEKMYREFLAATKNLDSMTEADFRAAHELMLNSVGAALDLNGMVVTWLRTHLGLQLQTHQWQAAFAKDRLQPFLDRILDFERLVAVETGRPSPLLHQPLGPLDHRNHPAPHPGAHV